MNKQELLTAVESLTEEELERIWHDAQQMSLEITLAKILIRTLPREEKEELP